MKVSSLRSESGSSGPVAKDCHRFLVAGPFFARGEQVWMCQRSGLRFQEGHYSESAQPPDAGHGTRYYSG